jgi:hypothetical protein
MGECQVSHRWQPACGKPGRLYRAACVHEHMETGGICDEHAALLNWTWLCKLCEAIDGHACLLTVVPVDRG